MFFVILVCLLKLSQNGCRVFCFENMTKLAAISMQQGINRVVHLIAWFFANLRGSKKKRKMVISTQRNFESAFFVLFKNEGILFNQITFLLMKSI